MTDAWQEATTSAERALRGDRAARGQVAAAVEVLCADRQLPRRPSLGQDVTYLVSLLDSLGLYDKSAVLLEHVASCFVRDPDALNIDAAVRNQLAVTLAEQGHLTAATWLLTGSAESGPLAAAALANLACLMLRRDASEEAANLAALARRAAVLSPGDEETEELLDVQVLAIAVLAEVTRQGNRHAEADQLVEELEGFARRLVRLLGGDHPKSLSALVTLAAAEFESAKAAGERERMERAADVIAIAAQQMSATLGTYHPRSLSVLQSLTTVEYETACVLGDDRRLLGASALMAAAARRTDTRQRQDPWLIGPASLPDPLPTKPEPQGQGAGGQPSGEESLRQTHIRHQLTDLARALLSESNHLLSNEQTAPAPSDDGWHEMQLRDIEVKLRRARSLVDEQPDTAYSLTLEVLEQLDALAQARQDADRGV
ncbi:hypothetical protein [Streptomyces sp. NBC_00827]|uniref:hypothetical protein n=1 Tax=Streptomyces sp. NBC_00827 TaxID=2903677 RepID=UPI003863EC08|nr:hypothetical protein OG569_41160 [Streptomyces sp. NBC_00827]